MESISELRKICQSTARKDKSNWYMLYVSRFFSIFLTRFLLPTKVTANQVSFAMIFFGILSCVLFIFPNKTVFFFASLLLQFWYILDCMDGEVARYRHFQTTGSVVIDKRQSSLTGMYYDMINHYIVNLLVPTTISLGLFRQTPHFYILLLGLIAGLGQVLMLAMYDCKTRTTLSHLKKFGVIHIVKEKTEKTDQKQRSFAHVLFMILHYIMTYPTVMNLVLISAILDLIWPIWNWRLVFLIFTAGGSAVVTTAIISRTIRGQRVEKDFAAEFTASD